MQTIKYFLFSLLTICFACNSDKQIEKNPSTTQLSAKLDSLGQAILEEGEILGFSVAIDSAGTTVYHGTFGHTDAEKTQAVTEETRFDIASVSKLIGVTIIMKLIEQGKLNMNQTLNELLPTFPEEEIALSISLHHLLSHTSGLQDYSLEIDSIFMETGVSPTKKEFLSFFTGKTLHFEPGTNYQYCNSGFMMMAFIAENSTGKNWQELIDEYINDPNELDFQLIGNAFNLPQTSPIFEPKGDIYQQVPTWIYVIGDGGLTATTKMLSKFPFHWKNRHIISQHSHQSMISPKRLNDSTQTGYGYGVRRGEFLGEPIIGHTGGWKSTYAIMSYFPERDWTFAGLMNTDGTPASMSKIFAQFMSIALGKSIPDYKNSKASLKNSDKFIGLYYGYGEEFDTAGNTISITKSEDGTLNYCLDKDCDPIYYMGNNKFWIERYPYDYIEFHLDQKGNPTALKEYYYGFFQVFRKYLQ